MKYKEDRALSDMYLKRIAELCGPYVINPSTEYVDMNEAADLEGGTVPKIACRVRRHGYYARYPYEFTIRSKRDSGAKTELSKIMGGHGDWMFYGHMGEGSEITIPHWMLIDLNVWRKCIKQRKKLKIRFGEKPNGDGTYFYWYDLKSRYNSHKNLLPIILFLRWL